LNKAHKEKRKKLGNAIRSENDATKLHRQIGLVRQNLDKHDLPCFNRMILNVATVAKRTDLIKLLLVGDACDLNSFVPCRDFVRPLIAAIQERNHDIVANFFRAGCSVTSVSTNALPLQNVRWEEKMSAIEFACTQNQLETLRFLVCHDSAKNRGNRLDAYFTFSTIMSVSCIDLPVFKIGLKV